MENLNFLITNIKNATFFNKVNLLGAKFFSEKSFQHEFSTTVLDKTRFCMFRHCLQKNLQKFFTSFNLYDDAIIRTIRAK
ncbi:hypothetical protein BpHYR1_032245 [Brachionus plicatilis]|uniref:Uncharacterized protein n=1 Tax=Brachionus plicatilis TaxID=10195 RepID=A0A3M7T9E0_BRAPC|nr:hypothetical protein BpHYR1_032245 [Brachionus plicatilis]